MLQEYFETVRHRALLSQLRYNEQGVYSAKGITAKGPRLQRRGYLEASKPSGQTQPKKGNDIGESLQKEMAVTPPAKAAMEAHTYSSHEMEADSAFTHSEGVVTATGANTAQPSCLNNPGVVTHGGQPTDGTTNNWVMNPAQLPASDLLRRGGGS